MKQLTILLMLFLGLQLAAQDDVDFYQLGGQLASEGRFEEAILNFEKELEKEPGNYFAWFNKALCESYLGRNRESISDFSKAIELNPEYHKAYLNRALVKKDIADYEGALLDVNKCLGIVSDYPEGLFHRGVLNEYLMKYEEACEDLTRAKHLGVEIRDQMIETACSEERASNYANILKLKDQADDKTYGYSGENPVKVGTGLFGGPSNQRAYLNLLRDSQGMPVTYERTGSCCDYKSENGLFGIAKTDEYEVTYLNKKGKKKKVKLYISFYDFEDPKVPVGFRTIED